MHFIRMLGLIGILLIVTGVGLTVVINVFRRVLRLMEKNRRDDGHDLRRWPSPPLSPIRYPLILALIGLACVLAAVLAAVILMR